jgi:hypothetical protein
VCEFPKILTEIKNTGILPADVCDNYISWHCLLDTVVKRHLSLSSIEIPTDNKEPRILSHLEQNAVRYTAGAIIRKLLQKYLNEQQVLCLHDEFLKSKEEVNSSESDTSEIWNNFANRGGFTMSQILFLSYSLKLKISHTNTCKKKKQ